MKSIHPLMESLGFSLQESHIYTELLKLGTTVASSVAKRLNINRSTAKYTLENLRKKGLVFVIKKNNTYYYTAEEPERILLLFREEEEKLKRKKEIAKRVIGPLGKFKNPYSILPTVQFFEGIEGVQKVYSEILENAANKKILYSFAKPISLEYFSSNLLNIVQRFIETRVEKKIATKVIMEETDIAYQYLENNHSQYREIRLIKNSIFEKFGSEIFFCGDTMYSFYIENSELFAYKIEHTQIVQMHTLLFTSLWDSLQK